MTENHRKGNIALLKAQTRAVEKGFTVSLPIGDHCRYDMIVDDGQNLLRAQVKYAGSVSNGAVLIELRKTNAHTAAKKKKPQVYSPDEIDLLLVYLPVTDQVYAFSSDQIGGKTGFNLRLEKPKNGQSAGVVMAENHIW